MIFPIFGFAQGNKIPFANRDKQDTAYTGGSLRVDSVIRLIFYKNPDTTLVLSIDNQGFLKLVSKNGGTGASNLQTTLINGDQANLGFNLGKIASLYPYNSFLCKLNTDSSFLIQGYDTSNNQYFSFSTSANFFKLPIQTPYIQTNGGTPTFVINTTACGTGAHATVGGHDGRCIVVLVTGSSGIVPGSTLIGSVHFSTPHATAPVGVTVTGGSSNVIFTSPVYSDIIGNTTAGFTINQASSSTLNVSQTYVFICSID